MRGVGRLRLALLAGVLVTALMLVPSGTAQAGKKMEVAVQDDSAFLWRIYWSRTKAFKAAKQLRVTRIRINILWHRVVRNPKKRRKPRKVRYYWAPYDNIAYAAAKRGMKVQAVLTGPPPAWATKRRRRVGPDRANPQ